MLQQLLELLLHAKSGVFAGVFLIGATGALVTATVENGVTTITVTQASPSPSASTSPTASPSASPSPSPSASPSSSPSPSPSPSPSGTPEASASPQAACPQVAAVKSVNAAFSGYHRDLAQLRREHHDSATRDKLAAADTLLKHIRQAAVKAIHGTATGACASADDDNDSDTNDVDQETNDDVDTKDVNDDADKDVNDDHDSGTTTTTGSGGVTIAFQSTDPAGIAAEAAAMMQLVFNDATANLPAPAATPSPTASNGQDRHGKGGKDNGKGHDKDD